MRPLVLLTAASVASGTVIESKIVNASKALVKTGEEPFNCDTGLSDIVVDGKDWTNVVQTVCRVWTTVPQFGEFPGKDSQKIVNILNIAVGPDGIWTQLKSKLTEANQDYCLRQEVSRIQLSTTAADMECPATVDEEIIEENPWLQEEESDLDRPGKDGDWNGPDGGAPPSADVKQILQGQWSCGKNGEGSCDCSQRFMSLDKADSFPMVKVASRPGNCKMVHSGKCYGDCPQGYRPTWLKGWFRPVCTSVCGATNHPVTCGVGCAFSRGKCAEIIMRQVAKVAVAAAKVAAFVISGPAGLTVAQTVENVVKIAEFVFNTLRKVLSIVDYAYRTYTREEANMATLVSIFQVVKDEAVGIVGEWNELQPVVSASTKLFMTLIDANFQWKEINIAWIANTLLQHGAEALTGAFDVASAFIAGKCELASGEVHFTVENVGDDRIIGPWQHFGTKNGKARYARKGNTGATLLEWDSRRKSWSFWVMDRSFGRGWWFGWLGFGWRELYESKSDTAIFATTGWSRIEGALPLPLNVNAKNGGE